MAFKIKKVTDSPFKSEKPLLCCTLSAEIECAYCDEVMCAGCGQKWGTARHFVLDLCRKRFTEKELAEAAECFKARQVAEVAGLGDCKVCMTRAIHISDRHYSCLDDIEDGQN